MTHREFIKRRGYQFERHTITTDDGYLLTAYRIPGKASEGYETRPKQPVLLQHGLLDYSGTWFFNEETLPFQLVDDGFDVWVLNSRGTVASKGHQYLSTGVGSEYWNFTVHEMAQFDVPAHVRYVKEATAAEEVIFIGHSQGTTQWFLANALDEELSKNFKAFVGIAPVVHSGGIHTPVIDTLVGLRL